MAKFKKKVDELVDATRWFKPGDHPAVTHKMLAEGGRGEYGYIPAGNHLVMPGDWIVTDARGYNFPLNDGEFNRRYAPAEGEQA